MNPWLTAFGKNTADLVERRCLLVVGGPRLATHRKLVIGALANRFHNVSTPRSEAMPRPRYGLANRAPPGPAPRRPAHGPAPQGRVSSGATYAGLFCMQAPGEGP